MNEHAKKAFAFIAKHKFAIENYKRACHWPDKIGEQSGGISKAAIEVYDDYMGLFKRLELRSSGYRVKSLNFADLKENPKRK
ncbi:MAG: hypothetical protein ACE5HI_15620 [bacterium]